MERTKASVQISKDKNTNLSVVDTSILYPIFEEPLNIPKNLFDFLIVQPNGANLYALYSFYYATAKWQRTEYPKAINFYVASKLGWGINKLEKYKAQLIKLGLIKNVTKITNGRISGHYVQIFFSNSTSPVFKVVENGGTIYSTNNINMLSQATPLNLEIQEQKNHPNQKVTPMQFKRFWNIYPKHVSEGDAYTAWNKLCKKADRPTWKVIKTAVLEQTKSEQWSDPKFIANASTWLNNAKWLNNAEDMKIFKKDKKEHPRIVDTRERFYTWDEKEQAYFRPGHYKADPRDFDSSYLKYLS